MRPKIRAGSGENQQCGFLKGPTQTALYKHRRWLQAGNFGFIRKYIVLISYYPCSENKGTDQLHSYCEADLRLCFRICEMLVFT